MIEIDMKIFGQRLKELRQEMGFTQTALAAKTGVTQNAISKYEMAKAQPYLSSLVKLAVVLEVSIDYIAGLQDWP